MDEDYRLFFFFVGIRRQKSGGIQRWARSAPPAVLSRTLNFFALDLDVRLATTGQMPDGMLRFAPFKSKDDMAIGSRTVAAAGN